MAHKKKLARLSITPCMVNSEIKKRIVNLVQQGDQCFVEEIIHQDNSRRRRKIFIPLSEVTQRMDALSRTKIPAFPVSPEVMDGDYVELTIYGVFSTLTLGWWTISPEGADGIREFTEWLRCMAFPDE